MNSLPDMVWSCVFLECPTQLESVVVPQHINTLLAAPVGPESSAASARPTGKRNSTCTMCHLHLSTLYIYIFQRTWLTWFYLYSSYVGDPWDPHVSTYLCLILFSGLPWTSNIKKKWLGPWDSSSRYWQRTRNHEAAPKNHQEFMELSKTHRLITPNLHLTQRHAACNSSGRRMSRVPWCGASGRRISLQLQNPNAELITNVCPVALVGYFKML